MVCCSCWISVYYINSRGKCFNDEDFAKKGKRKKTSRSKIKLCYNVYVQSKEWILRCKGSTNSEGSGKMLPGYYESGF